MRTTVRRPGRRLNRFRRPDGFYGWPIVAYAAVVLGMTAPGQTVGVSVFVDPVITGLGLSRSQVSTAYLIGTLSGALALPLVGRMIDRFGVRRMTVAIAGAFGAVLAGMSGVAGFLTLTVGFIGIRMLGQGSLSLASTTAVALWFDRRRGVAIGISSAAGAALMSLAPLVLGAAITRFDWRLTWTLAGLAVWAIVVPIAWFGLRDRPAELGQQVDGKAPTEAPDVAPDAAAAGWTRAEAMRTLMFWAITAAVGTSGLIVTALAFHQISLLGEQGLTARQAAANFLPQTAAGTVGILVMGSLVDRVAPRILVAASMGSIAVAMVLAQLAAPGLLAISFGIALGAGGGTIRTLEAATFPRYFGVDHIGEIRGLVMALNVAASAFGPLLLALGFERYGSYGPALTMLMVLPAAVALLTLFAPIPDDGLRSRIATRLATSAAEGT